jgi:hypothetical protein
MVKIDTLLQPGGRIDRSVNPKTSQIMGCMRQSLPYLRHSISKMSGLLTPARSGWRGFCC